MNTNEILSIVQKALTEALRAARGNPDVLDALSEFERSFQNELEIPNHLRCECCGEWIPNSQAYAGGGPFDCATCARESREIHESDRYNKEFDRG